MSSRLRKAYVAGKFYEWAHHWARARHSEAAAACSSGAARTGVVILQTRMSGSSSLPIRSSARGPILASSHGADDLKWFQAIGNRVGQRGIRRFQRKILSTSVEPNKGTPLQSEAVPNRAAEHRVTGFERVKGRSQGSSPINGKLHFVVHFG